MYGPNIFVLIYIMTYQDKVTVVGSNTD